MIMTKFGLQCTLIGYRKMDNNMKVRLGHIYNLFTCFTLLTLLIGFLTGCASSTEPSEAYKGEPPQEIYQRGKSALQDKSYAEAIKRFEALDVQYPLNPETEQAQLYLIYAYYMKEEHAMAVSAADRFIRLHPVNPHVDYAYYMRGVANYYQNLGVIERLFAVDLAKRDLTQIRRSYTDFSELYSRFPQSQYAPAAHQYMIYLRNVLADSELHIAEYYFDRKAYVAAINRSSDVVAHYQGAPAVPDALLLMAKSYRQLGMVRNEQEVMSVIQYNYPNAKVELS